MSNEWGRQDLVKEEQSGGCNVYMLKLWKYFTVGAKNNDIRIRSCERGGPEFKQTD